MNETVSRSAVLAALFDESKTRQEVTVAISALPATNTAECERLRGALEEVAKQHTLAETDEEGDVEYAYDALIGIARAALTARQERMKPTPQEKPE